MNQENVIDLCTILSCNKKLHPTFHKKYKPVCGHNERTYANECLMWQATCAKGETIAAVYEEVYGILIILTFYS